ncbi:hypothetical protein [Streptosporangium sp. NPDC002607]
MSSSPTDVLTRHRERVTDNVLLSELAALPTPAEVLDTVPDPRSRRRRRYQLAHCCP